ncbi:MAG: SGNH/GDSL hydrolase family protein [Planctomycetes bacterium]|nr:SGNH/GDSL hydrolase family protein [Planctomycetota bacterium]MBL7042922.1 SGNH/GDSL hydrolase family protein [Pirellulaceae bacterium]
MDEEVLRVVDADKPAFEEARLAVDVVCAGDSITGWNNFGSVWNWPYPTYPEFLQDLCRPLELRVVDGGIAGELSEYGLAHVKRYLGMFPNSRIFVIGFGTNDLGTWPDLERTSREVIHNLDGMVTAVREAEKQTILFNIPPVREGSFPPTMVDDARRKRDYHNGRLREYCQQGNVPLVDIHCCLHDEHFGDELHPNRTGAEIIAGAVFETLRSIM